MAILGFATPLILSFIKRETTLRIYAESFVKRHHDRLQQIKGHRAQGGAEATGYTANWFKAQAKFNRSPP
jgi:hypothetical protein